MLKLFWIYILILLVCSGCKVDRAITNTSVGSSQTTSDNSEVCTAIPTTDITAYQRSSLAAPVFGILSSGEPTVISGKTQDGWFAFDPGSAQAANVGPFRYRWFKEGGAFTLEGNCSNLLVVTGPPAGICFTMAQTDVPIREKPDKTSAVLVTMKFGDYTEVIGRFSEWFKVDTRVGSLKSNLVGWVSAENTDFNGPCDALPHLNN